MVEHRKLASIQYVHDVDTIEGADRIEVIGVLGWKCVAKRGEFKVGDRCVYFEIDSFLPIEERGESFDYGDVDTVLERARGTYPSGVVKEGIVIRPLEPVYCPLISAPLSMKAINNDYLLKKRS